MGNCLRSMIRRLPKKHNSEKSITLLIVGLDNAGKTLILNHIRGDPDKHVLPTMGFRIICLKYKSYTIKIYDLGGSIQIRSLWPKYYNDIHGLIYVVDASDISRLAENKVVFGELVAHESISGKPLLLLANKQDLNGAIDELDVVDNLDVEHIVNTTRCPTRVETCSCFSEKENVKNRNTLGITNGYKWLLDTILRNYTVLNNRVKQSQNIVNEELKNQRVTKDCKYSPPKLSVHSNPFKPIAELLSKKEGNNTENNLVNGVINGQSFKKLFMSNKTAPLPSENAFNINEDLSLHDSFNVTPVVQKSTQTSTVIDLPSFDLHRNDEKNNRRHRPNTAPASSTLHNNTLSIISIPGQVLQ
ncbi:ADP-ribosylation factor-like protein 13B [Vespula pensylvanica]|uniref:ADP-ribosylation factor-like protein 13B n=1 Tax=Vespula pensylvanica TaxID=30213 RepID=A0A834P9I2_VESPE|nr:ADP-ribosylation factor-like protein 13B [Vespula pensylvanica]KAF7434026.1 hypothetical protein H0235_002217 [Vespula pensylvanica]